MLVMIVTYRETLHQTLLFLGQTLSDVWRLFEALHLSGSLSLMIVFSKIQH